MEVKWPASRSGYFTLSSPGNPKDTRLSGNFIRSERDDKDRNPTLAGNRTPVESVVSFNSDGGQQTEYWVRWGSWGAWRGKVTYKTEFILSCSSRDEGATLREAIWLMSTPDMDSVMWLSFRRTEIDHTIPKIQWTTQEWNMKQASIPENLRIESRTLL
jgi:hypothetical protein